LVFDGGLNVGQLDEGILRLIREFPQNPGQEDRIVFTPGLPALFNPFGGGQSRDHHLVRRYVGAVQRGDSDRVIEAPFLVKGPAEGPGDSGGITDKQQTR